MSVLTTLQFVSENQPYIVPSKNQKAGITNVQNELCLYQFQNSFFQNTITNTFLGVSPRRQVIFTLTATTQWILEILPNQQFNVFTIICGQKQYLKLRGRCIVLCPRSYTAFFQLPLPNPDVCASCTGDITTQVKILCIGDSITEGGYCYSDPSTYESYLCTDLTTASPTQTFKICNQGVGGRTMITTGVSDYSGNQNPNCAVLPQPGTPCSYWDTTNWTSISTKAFGDFNFVLLMLGTNDCQQFNWNCRTNVMVDSMTQYLDNYTQMLTILEKTYPEAKIFVMRPPPACTDNLSYVPFSLVGINYKSDPEHPTYQTLFQALNTIASNFPSVTLIDLWTPFVEAMGGTDQLNNPTAWNAYLCDGIHPTPKGNELIANVIAPYLLKTEG